MTTPADLKKIEEEAKWLVAHPDFEERPASIMEFLGPEYLNIASGIRPGLKRALRQIFGETAGANRLSKYERAMVTGGIGIGKTTFAAIALPYMVHWVLCLKDPQKFFGLLPGSRIAFMQMSTSEQQAREVIFADIVARIDHSIWFKSHPPDKGIKRQIRWTDKDIWIIPGDSSEKSFEGYNILGGILDEMDSHNVTKDKDYADVGYDAINSRISSRFVDPKSHGHRGLLILIGQMKKASGFASRKKKEFEADPKAHVTTMTIWESKGWDNYTNPTTRKRESFFYDRKRREILPKAVADLLTDKGHLIEVPEAHRHEFESNPVKALRDLAGIPPEVSDPFIALTDRVDSAMDRWIEKFGDQSPVTDSPRVPQFQDWFRANGDNRKRVVHVDLAYSGNGDACAIAMGHVSDMIEDEHDGEIKPYITIDMVLRIKGPVGGEIMISDIRRYIYELRNERKFKIREVTLDGFQSTDTMQQLRKQRFQTDYLSVDRTTLPYEDLRDAIYEQRIDLPPYVTFAKIGGDKEEYILNRELYQLEHNGKKIDHPADGSKDCADAVAGVVSRLMGDRGYHKRLSSGGAAHSTGEDSSEESVTSTSPFVPAISIPGTTRTDVSALNTVPSLGSVGTFDPFGIRIPGT